MTERFITGTGQEMVKVHDVNDDCFFGCPIHYPTEHLMRKFPTHWRQDRYLMERVCPHGVGHPDPDHLAHLRRRGMVAMAEEQMAHGCDGCCIGQGPRE